VISNSIDAPARGGKRRVRNRASRRWSGACQPGIRITIADTGRGIDAENRNRIFEPFFTSKGLIGTGLGLWVTKDLIAQRHGQISFRSSTRPGRSGTVMPIFLPFEQQPNS
jgi:signal transduction histidine kinase